MFRKQVLERNFAHDAVRRAHATASPSSSSSSALPAGAVQWSGFQQEEKQRLAIQERRAAKHPPTEICVQCVKRVAKTVRDVVHVKVKDLCKTDRPEQAVSRNGYIDMNATQRDSTKPASFHVIIGNMPFFSMDVITAVLSIFDRMSVLGGMQTFQCCAGGHRPRVNLDACVARTFMSDLYDSNTMSISVVFIFSIAAAVRPDEANGSIMSTLTRPCKFSANINHWRSRATSIVETRMKAARQFGDEACKGARVDVARGMVESMFTSVAGRKIISPSRIEPFFASKAMLAADGRSCGGATPDAGKSERIRRSVQHCDLVFKVSYAMPMYVYTLLKNWAKRRERLDFSIDAQWKLVALFAEQSGLAGAHPEGTCFVGLVYLSESAEQACAEQKRVKRSIPTRRSESIASSSSASSGESSPRQRNGKRQRKYL